MSAIERMIDQMKRRGYADKTIKEYSTTVRRLADHFGCCPSKLTLEQVREYQSLLAKRNEISAAYYNSSVTAIRFLFLQSLGRDWSIQRLPYGRREHPLPVLLSRQEVFQLWRRLRQLKRRVLLMTAYSAALRTSELVHLRVEDLDPKRKVIRVKHKGGRDSRLVPYSPTLARLMESYLAEHDSPWLFHGSSIGNALAAGDIGAAAKILWLTLKMEWLRIDILKKSCGPTATTPVLQTASRLS